MLKESFRSERWGLAMIITYQWMKIPASAGMTKEVREWYKKYGNDKRSMRMVQEVWNDSTP
ncbi:MAG: hypothetical protein DRP55_05005 [Spirochaetes bacterium]|nr:MAG: hypothetical protein DRP55_05005 [Spirochaetota bacterium]